MTFHLWPLTFVFNIIGGDHGSSVDGRDEEFLANDQQSNICLDLPRTDVRPAQASTAPMSHVWSGWRPFRQCRR